MNRNRKIPVDDETQGFTWGTLTNKTFIQKGLDWRTVVAQGMEETPQWTEHATGNWPVGNVDAVASSQMYTVPRQVLELWERVHIYCFHVDRAVVSLLIKTMGLHFVFVKLGKKIKATIKSLSRIHATWQLFLFFTLTVQKVTSCLTQIIG